MYKLGHLNQLHLKTVKNKYKKCSNCSADVPMHDACWCIQITMPLKPLLFMRLYNCLILGFVISHHQASLLCSTYSKVLNGNVYEWEMFILSNMHQFSSEICAMISCRDVYSRSNTQCMNKNTG